jgi:hypothetical protein
MFARRAWWDIEKFIEAQDAGFAAFPSFDIKTSAPIDTDKDGRDC